MTMLRLSSSNLVRQGRILSGIFSHTSIRREKLLFADHSHSFSTVSSPDSKSQTHIELPQILESEIDARKMLVKNPILKGSGDFPDFPFTVRHNPDDKDITMTRNYNMEEITVEVDMPYDMDVSGGDSTTFEDDSSGSDSDDGGVCFEVHVTICKENGDVMKIKLSLGEEEITVHKLSIEASIKDSCVAEFDVKDAEDDNLQNGLRKYLEERGVKKDYYPFFKECMINHSRKLRLQALKKLRDFVID